MATRPSPSWRPRPATCGGWRAPGAGWAAASITTALVQSVSPRFRDHEKGLGLADRVRMVEILSGPDEALALLLSEG